MGGGRQTRKGQARREGLLGDKEELGHPGGAQSRAAAPPRREEAVEVVRASGPDVSWTSPGEVFQGRPSGGRPRTRWRDDISQPAWERVGEKNVWISLLRLLPPTQTRINVRKQNKKTKLINRYSDLCRTYD